jgi:hypothetical protein
METTGRASWTGAEGRLRCTFRPLPRKDILQRRKRSPPRCSRSSSLTKGCSDGDSSRWKVFGNHVVGDHDGLRPRDEKAECAWLKAGSGTVFRYAQATDIISNTVMNALAKAEKGYQQRSFEPSCSLGSRRIKPPSERPDLRRHSQYKC